MIIGIGLDTVHVPRFADLIDRRPATLDRLFVPDETLTIDGSRRSVASLAARFAAKEAVAKTLGAPAGLHWHDCRIAAVGDGRPTIDVTGTVAAAARDLGIQRWHVSLTHDGEYALAQVVAEGDGA